MALSSFLPFPFSSPSLLFPPLPLPSWPWGLRSHRHLLTLIITRYYYYLPLFHYITYTNHGLEDYSQIAIFLLLFHHITYTKAKIKMLEIELPSPSNGNSNNTTPVPQQ